MANLDTFSDKTSARDAAIAAGVPVVPGSDGALTTTEQVLECVKEIGLPVIIKASMGGGGKGMRVVREEKDLIAFFEAASSEALASFGDGSVFIERFVDRPRHIEVQIIGDGTGNVVHLWERDCSIQRRHQKVIEMAPGTRESLFRDTLLCSNSLFLVCCSLDFTGRTTRRPSQVCSGTHVGCQLQECWNCRISCGF